MSRSRFFSLVGAAILPAAFACGESSLAPDRRVLRANARAFDVTPTEVERTVRAEEFALADVDGDGVICGKGTLSTHVLLKDANAATPSQLCPPAWVIMGKTTTLSVGKWADYDKNANGQVCVKSIGDDKNKTVVKDDNAATPSQPCPPAFAVAGGAAGPKVDADDVMWADTDGVVCVNAVESGNFIARDDNNATPSQPCPPAWAVFPGSGGSGGGGAEGPAEPAGPVTKVFRSGSDLEDPERQNGRRSAVTVSERRRGFGRGGVVIRQLMAT